MDEAAENKTNLIVNILDISGQRLQPGLTMAHPRIYHDSLKTTFTGTSQTDNGTTVHSFRGIPYATIPARFERAQPIQLFNEATVDARRYGYGRLCQFEIGMRD